MKNSGRLVGVMGIFLICVNAVSAIDTREQLARFWKLAEDQVEVATERSRTEPKQASDRVPLPPERFTSPSGALQSSGRAPKSAPRPTIVARQSDASNAHRGNFGLELFGGLNLFKFTWGESEQRREDSIVGEL